MTHITQPVLLGYVWWRAGGRNEYRVLMQNLTQRGHLKDTEDDGRIISIHVYKLILQCLQGKWKGYKKKVHNVSETDK